MQTDSKAAAIINQEYALLCQQLGHLSLKESEVATEMASIKARISALNDLVPKMKQLEATIRQESASKDTDGQEKDQTAQRSVAP